MALRIGHLLDADNSDSEVNNSSRPDAVPTSELERALIKKGESLETEALNAIRANHHPKNVKDALKNKALPRGLTPQLKLTAFSQTNELKTAVDDELEKCGLEICRLLKFHYISVLEQANTKASDTEKEMNDICALVGSETEKSSLQNKCAELITKTNKCCEDKAKELKDKSSRKRGPDPNDGQAAPDPKRPRIAEMVLNNTHDRDTAILGLIKAGSQ